MHLAKFVIPLVVSLAGSHMVLAQETTIKLGVAGEKFNIAPSFTLAVDGTVIGEGTVARPLDTKTGTTIRTIDDPTSQLEEFAFAVPDGLLAPDATLVVQFTTSDYDPVTYADTNLYIGFVSVNGQPVDLGTARISDGANPDGEIDPVAGLLGLYAGGATASFSAPATGWPAPPNLEAAAAPEQPTQELAACTPATLTVTGFANNDANPQATEALADLAAAIAGQDCQVEVVGYSSMAGPAAVNQRYSDMRAQAVRQALIAAGVPPERIVARGAGETDRFGAAADNRRVEVSVAP